MRERVSWFFMPSGGIFTQLRALSSDLLTLHEWFPSFLVFPSLPFPSKPTVFPDTPLHSSETPRSSSLYQPESDDECRARAGEGNAATSTRDRQKEEGGGCHDNDSDGVSEDVSVEDVAAIETDHRRPSSPSESVSAEEVLESEAAQEDEQEEES